MAVREQIIKKDVPGFGEIDSVVGVGSLRVSRCTNQLMAVFGDDAAAHDGTGFV